MQVDASIFKAYDIRGIVPATLNEEVAEGLGRAFGTLARQEGETRRGRRPRRPAVGPGAVGGAGARPGRRPAWT